MASKWKAIGEGLVGATTIGIALLTPFLRSRRVRRGATDAEVQRTLPGDDLVPHPKWQYTNAITIEAPLADVWPWLVQIGQGWAGWYSYEWLENLVGCDIHNANQIIQEFQHIEVGDSVRLAAEMPGYPVAIVEPGRIIVLHADTRTGPTPIPGGTKSEDYWVSTWVFFLEKLEERGTRLISRLRSNYNPRMRNKLLYGPYLVEPISTAMQWKMLLSIKQRAEAGNTTGNK
ncbi:hypothetical protein ACFLVH_00860 [Chloroflexota bacterium]